MDFEGEGAASALGHRHGRGQESHLYALRIWQCQAADVRCPVATTARPAAGVAASGERAGIPWRLHRPSVRCWSTGDMSKVQDSNE